MRPFLAALILIVAPLLMAMGEGAWIPGAYYEDLVFYSIPASATPSGTEYTLVRISARPHPSNHYALRVQAPRIAAARDAIQDAARHWVYTREADAYPELPREFFRWLELTDSELKNPTEMAIVFEGR